MREARLLELSPDVLPRLDHPPECLCLRTVRGWILADKSVLLLVRYDARLLWLVIWSDGQHLCINDLDLAYYLIHERHYTGPMPEDLEPVRIKSSFNTLMLQYRFNHADPDDHDRCGQPLMELCNKVRYLTKGMIP